MHQPEFNLQCQVISWIKYQYPNIKFCASLGGVRVGIGLATKLKRMGYCKGFPDLMICKPKGYKSNKLVWEYCGLFIEFKAPNKKPDVSPEQTEWINYLLSEGYTTSVCNDYDEAIKIIKDYLG